MIDKNYNNILEKKKKKGSWYDDPNRKDVKRLEIPSYTFRHEFKDGFPAISTKKLAWKPVVTELLWFLKGDTNIKYLIDNGCNIWNKDAYNYYLKISNFKENTFTLLSFEDFVKTILVEKLNIHKIIIGYDHRFGVNRSADINDLINFGVKYNFEVEQISAKEIDDISISSTKIRKALLEGDVKTANNYLGYKYSFNGKVVEGKKNGRAIGYPTANIQIAENYKLIPKNGVYIVSSKIDEVVFYGMMNIGTNPTLGENEQTIEIHFFNFNSDIYSKEINISVIEYIREEQKFESLLALKAQLDKDKEFSMQFLTEYESTLF